MLKQKDRMLKQKFRKSIEIISTLVLIMSLALSAQAIGQGYTKTNLVSDIPNLAKFTDPNLVNPWGIARSSTSPWWVSDNGMGVSTLYNGTGNPSSLVVKIPTPDGTETSAPTGVVFNGGSEFNITPGKPARFIFVTEDGTIAGWNPTVNPTNAVIKVNKPGAVYKGVTIGDMDGSNILYAADFSGATIDVFDKDFKQMLLPDNRFVDDQIPEGFAPFNVQNIGGKIFVAFAKQDPKKEDEVAGPGLGFVDAFDANGNLIMRLKHGFWLNAPWAVTMAPSNFGKFSNHLLVGNFGSGMITAYDKNGNFHGLLKSNGKPIKIDGLWGLGFGNGANAGPNNTLFFAAGIDDEAHGLFGTIISNK